MKNLDILHQGKSVKFDHDAQLVRIEREERGHGDRYEQLQPDAMTTINRGFIGNRVDICLNSYLMKVVLSLDGVRERL